MAEGRGAAISFNIGYLRSLPGILRIAEVVLAIIVLICVSSAGVYGYTGDGFIYFTAATALIYSIVFTVLFLFNVPSLLAQLPWVLIILIANVVFTLFYFISFIIACVASSHWSSYQGNSHSSFGAAAFFTLVALIVHAFDAFLMFKDFRAGSRGGSGAANMPPSQPTPS